jgi:hypothetical protein
MKSFIQIAAVFMSPIILIGWVYGMAKLGQYLWGWKIEGAIATAIVVTAIQLCMVFALAPAVFEEDNNGG